MAPLPPTITPDPTLEAADKALQERARKEPRRTYLGMSAIGNKCSRKLWYDYHDPLSENFNAITLKRFDDGHRTEDLIAHRLRMAPGIQLWTVDPETGKQFECVDHDNRFKGHLDGIILGLYQAPKTPHVWEAKAVEQKSFDKFKKLKIEFGEKNTLLHWNPVYYAQAQCYMGYYHIDRHYLTVASAGGRDWDSCRTEFDEGEFEKIKNKAKRILDAKVPLAKLSNDPNWYECGWCIYKERCHGTS